MVIKSIKIMFICLKHGINPFSSVQENIEKAAERFSEKEKKFYINSCKSEFHKEYLRKHFYRRLNGLNIMDKGGAEWHL